MNRRSLILSTGAAFIGSPMRAQAHSVQAQIDAASRAGGAIIQLPAGDISVSQSLILRPGVVLRGSGRGRTRFIAARPSMRVFDRHSAPAEGLGGLEDLTVIGFGDRMPSRGNERDRAVAIGPFRQGWCRRIEVLHSRWVSITGSGIEFEVSDCRVRNSYRDGIQLNSVQTVRILNNEIDQIADDGIACHVGRGFIPSPQRSILIKGNKLSRCTGIKCLGASNAVIQNNTASFIYGYAVYLGVDQNFGEGFAAERNIDVSDNHFSDVLSLSEIGAGRGVAAIFLAGGSPGLKANDGSRIVHENITVKRNVIRQTLQPQRRELGLWWVGGAFQKVLRTDIVERGGENVRGVMFRGGALDSITVEGNTISGFSEPILFEKNETTIKSKIDRNIISNCTRPIGCPANIKIFP